jgi:dynactin-6
LIEESARIVNRTSDPGNPDAGTVPVMIIGNNNVFEVDCTSLALKIGDNNVLESKVKFQMENLKKVLMKSQI